MNEILSALGNFDTQLYFAIAAQRNPFTSVISVALTYLNWNGFFWWVLSFLLLRSRGVNRRGIAATATVVFAMLDAWIVAEILKVLVRRPRPFEALAAPGPLSAPETVIAHPSSFSFPSGDAALAMGAAVAFAVVSPRWRLPVLLLGIAAALARVVVGVHYPFDVIGGIVVGIVSGLTAPHAVRLVRRRLRWRAFVIPHTHWDREWEERFEGYRARLITMVSRLLDLLERDPEFRSFTFDGQSIAIQDYLEKRPLDRPRVAALVKADRLLIGPWHVLADLLLVSGESIVRNLQEGLRSAGELGRAARVAYVADPFGHPAQLPQILRGFGYDTYVFARGMGDEGEAVGTEFWWEAPSGDRVRTAHLVDHYANALRLIGPPEEDPRELRRRVAARTARILDRLTGYANGDALLLMVGDDHVEAYPRLPEAVRAMRQAFPNVDARIATLEEYAQAMPPSLQHLVTGEIVRGRYRPILRGVNSTRVWIKQENVTCERLLLEWCEPLDAVTGGGARPELRELWRTLLQNHPHDSICGCSIDAVHDIDMAPRFAFVRESGDALARRLLADIAGAGDAPMLWDPLPWPRDAVIDVDGAAARVRTAGVGVSPILAAEAPKLTVDGDGVIENEHLRVEVETDGSFAVIEKATGERSGRQNTLISEGDRGDEYTHSYAGPTVGSQGAAGRRTARVSGARACVTVELPLRLPAGLRADRLARAPELVDCPVRAEISLDAGARRVDVSLTVENRARDHRLRVLCETGTKSLTHHAGVSFALIERSNRFQVRPRWIEPPTAEACVHDLVMVKGATRGLAVGVDGLREYSVLHDGGTIAITLLRGVGWLSRGDLPERRGHAGRPLETPSAQCIGARTYRFAVVPIGAATSAIQVVRTIREWLSPPVALRGDGVARTFFSFVEPTPIVLSALRAGPNGSLVVRLANPEREEATASFRLWRPVRATRPVDLREGDTQLGNTGLEVIRTAGPLDVDVDVLRARLQPFEIGTWLVQLA